VKIAVLAYHNIGCRCLEVLIRKKQDVVGVFTHRDDPGENIWFDSVADLARAHGLSCHFPGNINDPHWVDLLKSLRPDLIFSFYFRQMLSRQILEIPAKGAINLHGSYLPRYRGRCPVNWVLVKGEKETGVTLHYMVERPDAGDIIAQARVGIDFEDTALTLHHKMERAAARLLEDALPRILAGTNPRIPQNPSEGSYFGGRRPEDGLIDWTRTSMEIHNLVRAVTRPYPGAFTFLGGRKVFIWKARPVDVREAAPPGSILATEEGLLVATGDGAIRVIECQLEGGPELGGFDDLREAFGGADRFDLEETVS